MFGSWKIFGARKSCMKPGRHRWDWRSWRCCAMHNPFFPHLSVAISDYQSPDLHGAGFSYSTCVTSESRSTQTPVHVSYMAWPLVLVCFDVLRCYLSDLANLCRWRKDDSGNLDHLCFVWKYHSLDVLLESGYYNISIIVLGCFGAYGLLLRRTHWS